MAAAEIIISYRERNREDYNIAFIFRSSIWRSTHHGFSPGADVPAERLFGNIDSQVTVGRVEPTGPFSLLFLCHELEGASQSQLTVLRGHGGHRGRDLHVVLRAGFFADNGVLVRVACSVSLEGHTKRKLYWRVVRCRWYSLQCFAPFFSILSWSIE